MGLGKCSWVWRQVPGRGSGARDQNLGEGCTFWYEMKCTLYKLPIYLTLSKFPTPVTFFCRESFSLCDCLDISIY